jgi:hypothetical protein
LDRHLFIAANRVIVNPAQAEHHKIAEKAANEIPVVRIDTVRSSTGEEELIAVLKWSGKPETHAQRAGSTIENVHIVRVSLSGALVDIGGEKILFGRE